MNKVELAKEMKSLGMEHVLWSNGGEPKEVEAINDLGYLSSRYDIYQDVFPPEAPQGMRHAGWPDDLVWLAGGDWMKGWAHHQRNPDGTETIFQGGVINSQRGLERAKHDIPEDLKTHAYRCRFIDTTTASPFREDYNPAHPLTRTEDRQYKMKLLEFCSRDEKLVVGNGDRDRSVSAVRSLLRGDVEPGALPAAGRRARHAAIQAADARFSQVPGGALLSHPAVGAGLPRLRGGAMVLGRLQQQSSRGVATPRPVQHSLRHAAHVHVQQGNLGKRKSNISLPVTGRFADLVRRLGYDEMTGHEFVSPDHAVQRTRWKSGVEIVVNFGDSAYRLPDGRTVETMASLVRATVYL